jgi:hypothetical protein
MARISVITFPPLDENTWKYDVKITESYGNSSKTNHNVTMKKDYYLDLIGGHVTPEDFVKRSFEFLLQREDKDSILHEFDIRQINDYFPEFEKEIKQSFDERD